jgi:DNA repair exonuclease SbcCD ATPase subunit
MLHFEKLRWKNFLSTGNVYTEIHLDRSPSTVVVGENGSGKSTMLDALCWVLFNKPFRQVRMLQLINTVNGKDTRAEVEFHVGTVNYKIVRGYKPSVFEIWKNGELMPQPGNVKDYQAILEEQILKLNYKSFTQVVILGSATFTPFMQLSVRDRREVIEDLLDIQIFSQMNTLLRDRMSKNKNDITDIEYKVELIENKIEVQQQYLRQVKSDIGEEIKEYEEMIASAHQTNANTNIHISQTEEKIQTHFDTINDHTKVQTKSEKVSDLLSKLHDKEHSSSKTLKFFESHDNCPTCDQIIAAQIKEEKIEKTQSIISKTTDAISELQKQNDQLHSRLEQINATQTAITELQQQISSMQSDIKHVDKSIGQYTKKIDSLNDRMGEEKTFDVEIDKLNVDHKSLSADREQLVNSRVVLDFAGKMLKDGGIKTKIIRQYVPIINKLVNKYLASMDFFVDFTLDEQFNEVIRSRHRDEFSYASFSEGEKARIDLSLMLTWRAVAKLKNSVNTNLLILDEVFDGSLDANGSEILMNLFREMSGTNIFVISHKSDQMVDKFRSMIKFEKVKSYSRIAT